MLNKEVKFLEQAFQVGYKYHKEMCDDSFGTSAQTK